MASLRKLHRSLPRWATSRSSGELMSEIPWWWDESEISRRREVFVAGRRRRGRIAHDLLEQQMHEQEQRLRLERQQVRVVVGIVVEMLVHAAVLDQHEVARLPVEPLAVVDVVAATLEHVEHGAVHVSMLLSMSARCVDLDVGLDRLRDCGGKRADHVLAVY